MSLTQMLTLGHGDLFWNARIAQQIILLAWQKNVIATNAVFLNSQKLH